MVLMLRDGRSRATVYPGQHAAVLAQHPAGRTSRFCNGSRKGGAKVFVAGLTPLVMFGLKEVRSQPAKACGFGGPLCLWVSGCEKI